MHLVFDRRVEQPFKVTIDPHGRVTFDLGATPDPQLVERARELAKSLDGPYGQHHEHLAVLKPVSLRDVAFRCLQALRPSEAGSLAPFVRNSR